MDAVASDYLDRIRFVAVAGRSTFDKSAERAAEWFSNLEWGLDESIWELYGVFGQPTTVLISGNDVVVDGWFGILDEAELRSRLDALASLGA